uniref:C-type lectin domain-containing protein n=1 Tax=Gouania willdenowi TaxID=441366 RepID=A0A8C5EQY1_GOUWI
IIVEKPFTWTEAQNYCRANHNDLATIENSEEYNKVIEVSRKYYNGHIWIGLRHYPSKWKWSMENEFKDGTDFRNWANTEPSDSTEGRENCVVTNNGLWFDTTCGSAFGFFCFTGKKVNSNTPMNWTSAMEYCRKHHVDLAVVRNITENNQLKEMVKNEYNWIGLHKDPWKWSDGKLLSYTKWNIGEPNQAQNYCRENYNDLATIENSEEHNEVIEVSRKYYTRHVWIGLRHYPSKWKWSMENEFKDGTDFRNWANTEPSDSTEGRENCVVTNNGLWFGTTCGSGVMCVTRVCVYLSDFICTDVAVLTGEAELVS